MDLDGIKARLTERTVFRAQRRALAEQVIRYALAAYFKLCGRDVRQVRFTWVRDGMYRTIIEIAVDF